MALRRLITLAAASTGVALLAVGCGKPPDLRPPTPTSAPAPSASPTPPSYGPPTITPTTSRPTSTATGFPESSVVACAGRPDADAVLALLRRERWPGAGNAAARVSTGPMCAGAWQWTVVQIPDADPLQVVSRGAPGALRLVTAGTDVCSIPVRTEAPAGIRAAACDAQPPSL